MELRWHSEHCWQRMPVTPLATVRVHDALISNPPIEIPPTLFPFFCFEAPVQDIHSISIDRRRLKGQFIVRVFDVKYCTCIQYLPNSLAFSYLGLPLDKLIRLRAPKSPDALWCAEQVLRARSCGALVFWQQHIRAEALRRLHLAAQATETLFSLVRPLASAADASPATLRLAVRSADGGVVVDIVKRRGPIRNETLSVALQPSPILLSPHGRTRRHSPAPAFAGGIPSKVVA